MARVHSAPRARAKGPSCRSPALSQTPSRMRWASVSPNCRSRPNVCLPHSIENPTAHKQPRRRSRRHTPEVLVMPNRSAKSLSRRHFMATVASSAALGVAPAVLRAQTGTLKAGVILPLSGVLSLPGIATRRGTEVAVKMFGEEGVKLDVQFADTESKPKNARIAAEKLIRYGATVLIGAWDSGATISAAQAAEAAKVPLVVNVGSAAQITEQGFT